MCMILFDHIPFGSARIHVRVFIRLTIEHIYFVTTVVHLLPFEYAQ